MASVGDYVQHRKHGYRGEVVNKNRDGWCLVRLGDGFSEEHEKHLIVIVKGSNG